MSTAQNAVTAEPGNSSATIRARVGDSAIDKVTRLFSASLADIFTETLQNSRRGGANRVAATIEQDGDTTRVTLIDDGAGITDPAILLTFGESGWKAGIAEAEDPAGFGLLALARRGCTLRWRLSGGDPSPGCRLVLEPAHFLGRDAAHVVPDDSAPWPHGTAVTFEASEAPHSVRTFLETAARHYPLPVTIGGETVERRAFLDGALHVEPWKGLVFGIFKDSHAGYRIPDVNFHGLTLPVRLPQIDAVESGVWSARADIDSCPDLELVLPARKEAVETPFLEEMREAARLAVYRAMAQADPAPRLAWTDWHKAKEAGIEMPEPPAELRPWRPAIADTDYWDERSASTAVGSGALVMQADPEPPEAQALHRALGLTRLQGESTPALRLFAAEPRFEGYPWYDTLARVAGIETLVTVDGAVRSLDYFTNRENGDEPERPETIVMHLNVLHPPKSPRHCFRKCDAIAVPADLAFAGEAWSSVHDALPLVTADSDIAPEELARLLRAAYFSPSDDAEADSWETQLTRFEETALHISLKLMCSVEEERALDRWVEAAPSLHDVGSHLPRPRATKCLLARMGIELVQHVGAHLDVEQNLGRDSVRRCPGKPVLGIDPDLQMDEAGCQRRRHAMHDASVRLPVAAGDQRGALGELVFADLAVEDELIERRLHHLHRGRQFFEVDEPAARIVRGRQEGRRRPAGPVGAVAPRDAAQVDGIEQERPDVDIPAAGIGGDLLGNGALGGAGRSPYQGWLAGLDQEREGGGEFAGAQRVVGGDGVGVGHRRAPEWLDGGSGTLRALGLRPAGSRNSRSVRRAGLLLETSATPGAAPRGMSARPRLRTGLRTHDRGREKWTSGIGNSRKPGSRWPAPPRREWAM